MEHKQTVCNRVSNQSSSELTCSIAFPKSGMRAHGTRYSSAGWADSVKSATRLAISRPTGHSGVVSK